MVCNLYPTIGSIHQKIRHNWPNFTNIKKYEKAVQNMEPVGKDWTLYDIQRVLGSARK